MLRLNSEPIQDATEAKYLGVTARAYGTGETENIARIKKTISSLIVLKRKGIHAGRIRSSQLIGVWNTCFRPQATHGVHLVPLTGELQKQWDIMEKITMINLLGCFSEKTRGRLRRIGRQQSLQETRITQMHALQERVQKRDIDISRKAQNLSDKGNLNNTYQTLKFQHVYGTREMYDKWESLELQRIGKLPKNLRLRTPPALGMATGATRRAATHWYCGTFPCRVRQETPSNPEDNGTSRSAMKRLMVKRDWTPLEEKEATMHKNLLKNACTTMWT